MFFLTSTCSIYCVPSSEQNTCQTLHGRLLAPLEQIMFSYSAVPRYQNRNSHNHDHLFVFNLLGHKYYESTITVITIQTCVPAVEFLRVMIIHQGGWRDRARVPA
jgi:hypothetical protein